MTSLARWTERRCAAPAEDPWQPHAATILAYLSDDMAASILGKDWRAIRIGQQTVHWCVPNGHWRVYHAGGPAAVGLGIRDLWMLVRDVDHKQAALDLAAVVGRWGNP